MTIEALIRNNVVLDDTVCSIPLDKGLFAIIDKSDYAEISKDEWYAVRSRNNWYAARRGTRIDGKFIFMHNIILGTREGMLPDHKNRNGLDNRRLNLRFATHQENIQNQKRRGNSVSKYKGVSFCKRGGWRANIRVSGKLIHLGYFGHKPEGEIEAARAYDKAAIEHFGEFANINLDYPGDIENGKN